MKASYAILATALVWPVAGQVSTTGSRPATTGAISPPPAASSAPTVAGPAGSGTVTLPPAPGSSLNAGAIIGGAPGPVGGTFSRPVIGAPPASMLSGNPAGVTTASGFPPPIGPVPPIVTNTGIGGFNNGAVSPPEAATFPNGAPPYIGGVVGTNFVAPATNFPPRRALSVDLPPGATVVTNVQGVPEAVVPPPPVIPVRPGPALGAPGSVQSGSVPPVIVPRGPVGPPTPPAAPAPPRNPHARIEPVPRPR